ncbi:MAG: hypothetical protein A3E21_00990 [Sulfurimonas sp. RIFCSPHIGHO2_12_FULL_36_9]|uniref:hypothetical protein n=1 Tax=Sulfurimonas sp. RIFCSPLOWO2_12_36_12 TaxID=1802253 RepID=UPI0008C947BE|nr:hypothetical protein [Sulfurimonas sp. RIFCSPLOWO2_12_36_12]OHD96279.1 MAG: hypothetical protein A3E21_00990 [Sulfurimonas sp. RIFCSPHIGHO2_12_FULL_36_9]OHD98212.1 MAG: hypothetical protein A3J26_02680 [Sulfurimonas sp. RIFCSPLOWO2_02_FULL_36_28]OHE01902.1 MAG: hypothetical protein A2W82_08975 [Sulfurimonas sp. RIFCSPLOWO2_12_36_12]
MNIQTELSVLAIIISIFTFIFTILVDLKSSIQSIIKQKYLYKLSDIYIEKLLILCHIRLNDRDNKMRKQFDNNIGLFRLKESFFIEKLTSTIDDLKKIQSQKIFFSKKLDKRIEILEIIRSVSQSYLKLTTLDEIIYHGTTANTSANALGLLFQELKTYKNIKEDQQIWNITTHWRPIKNPQASF